MIRRRPIERKPEEFFEGQTVVDLVFEFGVGVDAEPFLKEHAFEKQQGRVGIGAFTAGSHGVMSHQDLFNAPPINGVIELVHEFEAAIVL